MAVPRRYTQPKYDYRTKKRKKSTSWKDRLASFAESRKRHFADILAVKKAKAEKASAKAKAPPKKKDWYDLKEEEKTDPDAFGKHQYEESKKSPHKSVRKAVKAGAKRRGIIPTKTVKTKGGDYGVYAKKSRTAQSFRDAFRDARKSGAKTFEWKGKKYSSALAKKKKKVMKIN